MAKNRSYKQQTSSGSREQVYLACPLCGRSRVLESERARQKGKGELRWDFFDPETGLLVQIREAGGKLPREEQPQRENLKRGGARALGFKLRRGLTIKEAGDNGYGSQVEAIKRQINILCQFINQI